MNRKAYQFVGVKISRFLFSCERLVVCTEFERFFETGRCLEEENETPGPGFWKFYALSYHCSLECTEVYRCGEKVAKEVIHCEGRTYE